MHLAPSTMNNFVTKMRLTRVHKIRGRSQILFKLEPCVKLTKSKIVAPYLLKIRGSFSAILRAAQNKPN